jgi:TRAP-type C4-dicarboxylate transport system permease small subunit
MRVITAFTRWIALAGAALLLLGVLMTIADIVIRQTGGGSVPGTVDLMQLIVMWSALAAIPYGFLTGDHVAVDLLTERFAAPVQRALSVLSALLSTAFLWAVCYFSAQQAWLEFGYGDRTQTLGIPIIYYWVPMLAGMFLAGLAALASGAAVLLKRPAQRTPETAR